MFDSHGLDLHAGQLEVVPLPVVRPPVVGLGEGVGAELALVADVQVLALHVAAHVGLGRALVAAALADVDPEGGLVDVEVDVGLAWKPGGQVCERCER